MGDEPADKRDEVPDTCPVFDQGIRTELRTYCVHDQKVMDENKRTVKCEKCGAVLDPFDVLMRQARGDESKRWKQKEAAELAQKVARLRAEEKRIKARTRNAHKKDADAAVVKERAKWDEARKRIEYELLGIVAAAEGSLKKLGWKRGFDRHAEDD